MRELDKTLNRGQPRRLHASGLRWKIESPGPDAMDRRFAAGHARRSTPRMCHIRSSGVIGFASYRSRPARAARRTRTWSSG
jgi:hypothetical protein